MASERAVTGAFETSALSHGFASAHAELAGHADLKAIWERNGTERISFRVSDYLLALSEGAVRAVAEAVVGRILGGEDAGFGCAEKEISSPEFAGANQKAWLERHCYGIVPASWEEYLRLAGEQSARIPEGAVCVLGAGEGGSSPSFRVAAMPEEVASMPMEDQLRWIDAKMVEIAGGLRGCNAGDAPASFVEVA